MEKKLKKGDFVISPITHKSNSSFDKIKDFDRHLTKGKEYLVEETTNKNGGMFIISDDNNKLIQCYLTNSSHINFMDWIIKK